MPISFLAPAFLAGLAAIAIPVLIHLAHRPKKQVTRFPSLMFLERIEYQESRRRSLRDLFLLALRVLALVLVAAAFARPYLDRPDAPPVAVEGGREVVVLVDRSASMGIADRLAEARRTVAEVADGLRRGDRATLVVFDIEARAVNRATDQPAVLRAAVDTVTAGDAATRFGPALRLAESILIGSPLPRRELVLISDFQRRGWDAEAGVALPPGTEVRTVAVGRPVATLGVAGVSLGRERFSGRERVRVSARIQNHGTRAAEVPVELVVDGRTLESRRIEVPAEGAAVATFDPLTLPERPGRAEVRVPEDGFPLDDAFRFTLAAHRNARVLVLEPRSADTRSALYLSRALEVSPEEAVAVLPARGFGAAQLADVSAVILNDVDALTADQRRRLRQFAEAGGGVVTVLGERSRAGSLEGLLPGELRGTRDRAAAGGTIARFDAQHPVFEPFQGAASGGLSGARFYRYRELEPEAAAVVLARYDDGAPALVEQVVGTGRLLALTSPLDGRWNDLVLQPAWVPLALRLVRHASGREPEPAWRTVGDLLAVAEGATAGAGLAEGSDVEPPVVVTPSGRPLDPAGERGLVRLAEAGFYQVRDARSATPPPPIAVNADPAEADPVRVDPAEVAAAITPAGMAARLVSSAPEDRERRQALWWFVLAGAFVLMTAESMVGNRLSRRATPMAVEARES